MASTSFVRWSILILSLASAAYAVACGSTDDGAPSPFVDGDGGGASRSDAAVSPSDAEAPATTVRLAHLAPDLGPLDFCYRTVKASSFEGPVLGGGLGGTKHDAGADASAGDDGGANDDAQDAATSADNDNDGGSDDGGAGSGPPSVRYRTVSRYLTLDAAGPLTLALVAPGSTSCATPLFTADVTLDPGKLSTVAVVGRAAGDGGDAQLSLVAFIDDRATVPDHARVRMIHAALGTDARPTPAGTLAVRVSASQTVTIADHVEPKKAGASSTIVPVDSLGYATVAPIPSPAQLAVGAADGTTASDASTDSWTSTAGDLELRGGSLHTGFVLTGDHGFEVLWCTDTSTSGDDTTCMLLR